MPLVAFFYTFMMLTKTRNLFQDINLYYVKMLDRLLKIYFPFENSYESSLKGGKTRNYLMNCGFSEIGTWKSGGSGKSFTYVPEFRINRRYVFGFINGLVAIMS